VRALIIVMFLLVSLDTSAWMSGDEPDPGPNQARRVLAAGQPENEHADLMLEAFNGVPVPTALIAAGVPADFATRKFPLTIYFTDSTRKLGLAVPESFLFLTLDLDFQSTETKNYTLSGLAALPDHSYSLWDWIANNYVCPQGVVEAFSATPTAVQCHKGDNHLGATNSTHFLPQSEETYKWYHELAVSSARECSVSRLALQSSSAYAPNKLFIDQIILECVLRSFAFEAFGQHFLQDSWAVGHMWQRWGSPNINDFPSPSRQRALLVALAAGTIHGIEPMRLGDVRIPDSLSSGQDFGILLAGSTSPIYGLGDLHRAELAGAQHDQLILCSRNGISEVWSALNGDAVDTGANYGTDCFGQRATNFAMAEGMGVDHLPNQYFLCCATFVADAAVGIFPASLTIQWRAQYAALDATARISSFLRPTETDVANGPLAPLDNFLGIGRNGDPNPRPDHPPLMWPPAIYADQSVMDALGNPAHLETEHFTVTDNIPIEPADVLRRGFSRANAKHFCSAPETNPVALQASVTTAIDGGYPDLTARCAVCTEFVARNVSVNGDPSVCSELGEPGLQVSQDIDQVFAATPMETAAQTYCGCQTGSRIAETGLENSSGETITSITGTPSVNQSGEVAFVANTALGASVYAGNGITLPRIISLAPSTTRSYSQGVQINDSNFVVARDRRSSGSFVRRWDAAGTTPVVRLARGLTTGASLGDFGSVFAYPSMNNAGQPVFGATSYNSSFNLSCTELCLVTGAEDFDVSVGGGRGFHFLPYPSSTVIRPMIADNGQVVYQDGGTNRVYVLPYELNFDSDVSTPDKYDVSAAVPGLLTTGNRPGITDQGSAVAFAAEDLDGTGIWLSVQTGSDKSERDTNKIAGFRDTPELGMTEDAIPVPLFLDQFLIGSRVGVIHQEGGAAGLLDDVFIVTFIATPNAMGPPSDPVGCMFGATQGLWTARVTVGGTPGAYTYVSDDLTPIVQIGDAFDIVESPRTVTSIDIYDPIASTGPNNGSPYHIAYIVRTTDGVAVDRTRHISGACPRPLLPPLP